MKKIPFGFACLLLPVVNDASAASIESNDYCKPDSGVHMVDTSIPVTKPFLDEMVKVGVGIVARYYDYAPRKEDQKKSLITEKSVSKRLETIPGKTLRAHELQLLKQAGLKLLVVFQHNGQHHEIFQMSPSRGHDDARRALALAKRLKQPKGSAIYFAVDNDFVGPLSQKGRKPFPQVPNEVYSYFQAVRKVFKEAKAPYKIGVYGGGATCNMLVRGKRKYLAGNVLRKASKRPLADYCWLSHSVAFTGTKGVLKKKNMDIRQLREGFCAGRDVDFNVLVRPKKDVGAFVPGG